VALDAAVRMLDAHEHVGDGGLQPGDTQRLAGQAARHCSVPRTTTAPGVSCCWSGVESRQPSGTTGAIWISTSPPVGRFHSKA